MSSTTTKRAARALAAFALTGALLASVPAAAQSIPAAHVYHNHMPNFWPYYANTNADVVAKYNALAVGAAIRYTSDGDVILLKQSPPANYPYYLPSTVGTGPMPHDDLVSYYSANAKYACYQSGGWPMSEAEMMQSYAGGNGQVHVTFSGALATNVNSIELTGAISGLYNQGSGWNAKWVSDFNGLTTKSGFKTMDMIHFAGHHSLGPLIGNDYLLKDLVFHGAIMAQPWFLGSSYKSSHGFFPTEESFTERMIPVLTKLGIGWTVLGNNHYSHTLTDYPFATYDANGDAMISPPNRADLRNTSSVGAWVVQGLTNQQQQIVNKFPFASTPHWVRYVDPLTGAQSQVAGVPTSQNGQWAEGYLGSVTVDEYVPYVSQEPRQFYVVAHDGDNSSGRSGSWDTWQAGITVTGSGSGYNLGIDEYLKAKPIPASDVVHVQDGSWADVLDASTDPMFYHWHLPPIVWSGQFSAMNTANGTTLAPKKNLKGVAEGATISFEYGWHYQEIAYAKLQPALNYAKTAEQIWLDNHLSYWSPTTTLDNQVTYGGNQLNPWMIAAPVKGDPNNDWKGGANPAELAWYFLLPSIDSGFGYYGENQDDDVKPVLAINNSLAFSQPYVQPRLSQDRTGPSVWVPQRWPANPGSVNASKAEGWTTLWFNHKFGVYTYAADAAGIASINVMIRPHTVSTIPASDDTYKVIHPSVLAGTAGLSITPSNVGSWTAYPMQKRDMHKDMNGVSWIPAVQATMNVVKATDIGDLYYAYLNQYRNQYVDYFIQATDVWGNITETDIQQTWVGPGTYTAGGNSGYKEDAAGTVAGTEPFLGTPTFATAVTAMPDYLPASGVYGAAQSVKILCGTAGAAIYYTTDGSTPTTASTRYTGPVTVSGSTVLKAIAVASGLPTSGVSSSTYVIGGPAPQAATPTFSPAAGTYATAQTVTISDATSGAAIYYTTDGSTPTTASTRYTAPITVSASRTVKAIATATGYTTSNVGSAAYVIGTPPQPPTGVTATGASGSTITVAWTASTGATSYTVYRSSTSTGTFASVGSTASTSLTDSGLVSGTTYYYYVTASNGAGASAKSTTVPGTTLGFTSPYAKMYLRGTMSATTWDTSIPMALVANDTWQVTVTLAASTAYSYKYDTGSWASGQNWGAGGTAGVAVVNSGTNIAFTSTVAGTYTFKFNDSTLAYSVTAPAPTIPLAPTNVVATAVSGTQINLTWTASAGATSYTVNRGPSSNGPFVVAGTPTGTSFSDTGLTAGTQYFYYLTASNSAGTSSGSMAVYATTPTPPAAPTGVTATPATGQITVAWTAVTGATSYTVYRSTSSTGTFASVGTPTGTTFVNTGLAGSTTYSYYVKATGAGGTSAASATVSATTPPGGYTSPYAKMYLRGTMSATTWDTSIPMTLVANNTWRATVTLAASTAYQYKYDASGAWTSGQNWGAGGTAGVAAVNSGTNIGYTSGAAGTYTFTFNDSTLAYTVSAPAPVIPAAPTNVTATAASGQITVAWTASAGATSYTVYRAATSAGPFTTSVGTSTTTSFVNTGLAASTTYYYQVSATNAAGTSASSATASATTPAPGTTTTIRVHFDVGYGNTVYIRGSVSPLSWTAGQLATWTTGNVWVWSTTAIAAGTSFEYKAVKNDSGWSDGANYVGTGGQTMDIYPTFNGNFYDTMDTIATNWSSTGGTTTAKWVQGTLSGSGVASCTNCSTAAYLTLIPSLNKVGTTVTLGFKYAVTGLTSSEYLKVDVYKGGYWYNLATYYGTVAATNKSIDITSYGSTALKLRFRAYMVGSTKSVTVDNVTVAVK